jgi:hypothetical protein
MIGHCRLAAACGRHAAADNSLLTGGLGEDLCWAESVAHVKRTATGVEMMVVADGRLDNKPCSSSSGSVPSCAASVAMFAAGIVIVDNQNRKGRITCAGVHGENIRRGVENDKSKNDEVQRFPSREQAWEKERRSNRMPEIGVFPQNYLQNDQQHRQHRSYADTKPLLCLPRHPANGAKQATKQKHLEIRRAPTVEGKRLNVIYWDCGKPLRVI